MNRENTYRTKSAINNYYKVSVPRKFLERINTEFVQVKVSKNNISKEFISLPNSKLTIRKSVRDRLNIQEGDNLDLVFSPVHDLERPEKMFSRKKIDMLYFVPEKTSKGYNIIVSQFTRNESKNLRIWCSGSTKGVRQIEIKRFIDIDKIGTLIGQYQAEGEKYLVDGKVVFTNKLLEEHKDFIGSLKALKLNNSLISHQFLYNSEKLPKNPSFYCKEFQKRIGREITGVFNHDSKGPWIYRTTIRNVIFAEIVLKMLDSISSEITDSPQEEDLFVAESYIRKLLTGDGTLDITVPSSSTYQSPKINLKIADKDKDSLENYKQILSVLGFHPHISNKECYVRSSCSLQNLIFLYRIKAFRNNKNWKKLILAISIVLEGRRYRTYKRFIELREVSKISSQTISENYDVSERAGGEWLNNKVEEGLLSVDREKPYPKLYVLTCEGENLAEALSDIIKERDKIRSDMGLNDSKKALEALKRFN